MQSSAKHQKRSHTPWTRIAGQATSLESVRVADGRHISPACRSTRPTHVPLPRPCSPLWYTSRGLESQAIMIQSGKSTPTRAAPA